MHTFTIFTPTYNRCDLLPRLYESIKRQTFKDLVWLVINEKSTDRTLEVLESFRKERVIDICIIDNPYIPAIKHTALKYAFEICNTPYLIDVDDDDELFPNALQTFNDEIRTIEKKGKQDIGSIRALTVDDNGNIMIKGIDKRTLFTPFEMSYLDVCSSFAQMENLTCFYVEKVRNATIFARNDFFLSGKESFIFEGVFWGRLSRFYSTRYLPAILRLYHVTSLSACRQPKSYQYYLTLLINLMIVFDEQNDYLRKSLKEYLKTIIKINTLAYSLGGVKYSDLLSNIRNGKAWFIVLFPVGIITSMILFRNKYKKM